MGKIIAKTGKRGRKPIKDKVIPLTVYVKESIISKFEGVENARAYAKKCLENAVNFSHEWV